MGYNALSKLLHHVVLGSASVSELTFDLERTFYLKGVEPAQGARHVFVSGLARSGTTVLMRALHSSGELASLTYRDMPFALAPNLWHRLTAASRKSMELEQRAHGDGVLVDFDSPEALEEVFWRTFEGEQYIRRDCLICHSVDQETEKKFIDYLGLILLRYGKKRYLSKNNNNILRLRSLLNALPNAVVLIPFREPIQQAYSLLKQDERFTGIHRSDSFSRRYMTWLVHHEFGADHRPFNFDGREVKARPDKNSLDYWIGQWVSAYSDLAKKFESAEQRVLFVNYGELCSKDSEVWKALSRHTGIEIQKPSDFIERSVETPAPCEQAVAEKARTLYSRLCEVSRSQSRKILQQS